tara:strand:- start:17 stop:799 length:783 start_codon:yes stop_codon:yes gene_type:complete
MHLEGMSSKEAFREVGKDLIREMASQCDLLVVFGGDGTMLHVARSLAGCPTPLLGINTGGLGFLTAAPYTSFQTTLEAIWKGQGVQDVRPSLHATLSGEGKPSQSLTAINDIVISRGTASRMIELEVKVDGELLTQYRCDGFIICTPTGSTAYSLSAGGAIVCPNAQVFTLTPICPHTLSNRSVIVSMASIIEVTILSKDVDTVLTADGQIQVEGAPNDRIRIHAEQDQVTFLNTPNNPFFSILRQKMQWSGSNLHHSNS